MEYSIAMNFGDELTDFYNSYSKSHKNLKTFYLLNQKECELFLKKLKSFLLCFDPDVYSDFSRLCINKKLNVINDILSKNKTPDLIQEFKNAINKYNEKN